MKKLEVSKNKHSSFVKDDHGVVGIVVTVLIIGLILAVMVMIQTVYIPQWIEEKEAIHMDEVANGFAQLKYALDIQGTVEDSTTISTYIPLGSNEIPFFNIGRSFDRLFIKENNLKFIVETNNTRPTKTFSSDSIIFSSQNMHYVNQDYIYEGGAMILNQDPSCVLYGKPSIIVTQYNYSLTFTIINISGVTSDNSVSGNGIYPIYTEIENNEVGVYNEFENVTNITITTLNPHAWHTAFNSTLRLLWSNYTIEETDNQVKIRFVNDQNEYIINKIYIREVDVKTQIAFGLTD